MGEERQPGLFEVDPESEMVKRLVRLLEVHGWLKRSQIAEMLSWEDRTIRAVAQAAGPRIVRGQRGFNAIENVDEATLSKCAAAFEAQGNLMIETALAWRRAAHKMIG